MKQGVVSPIGIGAAQAHHFGGGQMLGFKGVAFGARHALGGQAGTHRFEFGHHLDEVDHMFGAQLCHNGALVGAPGHQTHGGKLAQRLAHRGPRDEKPVGEGQFVEFFAGAELAGNYGIGQLPDNVIDCIALARQTLLHQSGPIEFMAMGL